jgi:hypothetical protein
MCLCFLKKGNPRSANHEMNLLRAASLPASLCASFLEVGGSMYRIALIFSGLASIPLTKTRHPSSFPLLTPNMHFSGFSFNPALWRLVKALRRSWMWSCLSLLYTTMSST